MAKGTLGRGLIALLSLGAMGLLVPQTSLATPNPPTSVTVWYIALYGSFGSDEDFYDMGHDLGQKVYNHEKPQDVIVIFDWGGEENSQGTWGAVSILHGVFASKPTIRNKMQAYARGYFAGTSTDNTAQLMLAVGTNNERDDGGTAGQQWGDMIVAIQNYLSTNPTGSSVKYSSQVTAVGANDIEHA